MPRDASGKCAAVSQSEHHHRVGEVRLRAGPVHLRNGAALRPLPYDQVAHTARHKPKRAQPLDLRRVRNLLANPNVCLTVDRYDEDWSRLAWLQVRGQARLLDDPAQRIRAVEALRGKYAQYRTMDLERRPMIEIRPSDVRAWRASENEPGSIRS